LNAPLIHSHANTSPRAADEAATFSEAVEADLAPDGGLFLPEKMPNIADNYRTGRS